MTNTSPELLRLTANTVRGLTMDAVEQAGMTVHSLSEGSATALAEKLPAAASVGNPIDVLGDADPERRRPSGLTTTNGVDEFPTGPKDVFRVAVHELADLGQLECTRIDRLSASHSAGSTSSDPPC